MKPDPHHPDHWKKVVRCRTAEQEGAHIFKHAILNVCDHWKEDQAEHMRIRVQGAVSDLNAAETIYHKECGSFFMAPCSVNVASTKSSCQSEESNPAFQMVVNELRRNPSRIWNAVDFHKLCLSYLGSCLLCQTLTTKLADNFGNNFLYFQAMALSVHCCFSTRHPGHSN